MSASRYLAGVDTVTGVTRHVARLRDVLGAAREVTSPKPVPALDAGAAEGFYRVAGRADDVTGSAPASLGVAAVGVLAWPKHRVLGGIGGASLGWNVPALFRPGERRLALRNLGTTGAGVVGSLLMPAHPVVGFVLGSVVGGLATYFGGLR